MVTKKDIEAELNDLKGLKTIVETYEEIAASRIRKTRESVLKSRSFMDDLSVIFSEVKSSYKNEVEALMKRNKKKNPLQQSFFIKNNKTLCLLISANTGLYGDIIRQTFEKFLKESEKADEIAIMGRLGENFYLSSGGKRKYAYFDFPDSGFDDTKLKEIVNFIIRFEKVVVFFEKFQSIINQTPQASDISGNIQAPDLTNGLKSSTKYFFEPSLEKIMAFFEGEIFSSIFEQTIKESQLAKFAARIVSLDNSTENIRKRLESADFQKNKLGHAEQNKKQQQTFSSMRLWAK